MLPLIDAMVLLGGNLFIAELWGRKMIYPDGGSYPETFYYYVVPFYILIWLISIFFSGGYDKPVRIRKSVTGMAVGTVVILVLYALMPGNLRFSRALILLFATWGLMGLPLVRLLFYWFKASWIQIGEKQNKRFIVIGDKSEVERVSNLLNASFIKPEFVALVSPDEKLEKEEIYVGSISQVIDIISIYNIDEVVFCSKSIPHQVIIDKMTEWKRAEVDYKIAPEDSLSIIGSNSIHTKGDLYTVNINAIDTTVNRRNKRLLDFVMSGILFILSPVLIFLIRKPAGFLKNSLLILFGKKSLVGYYPMDESLQHLPKIKKGVLNPVDGMRTAVHEDETILMLNILYARDYNVWKDMNIILYAFRDLGK
jgi:hypothetical protein